MSAAKSFYYFGREGRKYRCAFNGQRGVWFAAFKVGTKRQRVSLSARTKTQAEHAVKLLDAPPPPPPPLPTLPTPTKIPERLKWSEFQNRYLESKTAQDKAPNSVKRFKAGMNALGRFLKTKGIKYTDEITLEIVEGFIPYRTKTENRKAKTAFTDAIVVKNALKWGSRATRGLLSVNPALDWETKKPVSPKRRTYTASDVEKMEAGVRDCLKPIVTTLAWTGMRIGELVNLRWTDIDFDQHVLHIRVQENWKPKGRRDRMVPMLPKVEAVIRKQQLGEYVFSSVHSGRVNDSNTLQALKKDQIALGLLAGDLHAFRRFFATTMMNNGTNPHTVMQWGGWKSLETMLRYLADTDVKDSVRAMDEVAKRLAGEHLK